MLVWGQLLHPTWRTALAIHPQEDIWRGKRSRATALLATMHKCGLVSYVGDGLRANQTRKSSAKTELELAAPAQVRHHPHAHPPGPPPPTPKRPPPPVPKHDPPPRKAPPYCQSQRPAKEWVLHPDLKLRRLQHPFPTWSGGFAVLVGK